MSTTQATETATRVLPRYVGLLLGVIALVTAVPATGVPYLFIRFIFRYNDNPISSLLWLVCLISFVVGAACLLAFLFLYLSGRFGKEKPFRRFLPAWIAMGVHGAVFAAIVVSLIIRIVLHILLLKVGVF